MIVLVSYKKLSIERISFIVLSISVLVVLGWVLNIEFLKSIHPQWVTMKFFTAIAFILSAVILALLNKQEGLKKPTHFNAILALSVICPMLLVFITWSVHTGFEDALIHESPDSIFTVSPNRPSLGTMFLFFVIAGS